VALMERFRTIVADPPWHYEGGCWDRQVSRSSSHYDTLTVPETASLGAELSTFIANDAYLFLWITSRFIIEGAGKAVPEAWGFRPLTTLVWCKPQIGTMSETLTSWWSLEYVDHLGRSISVISLVGSWITADATRRSPASSTLGQHNTAVVHIWNYSPADNAKTGPAGEKKWETRLG
jgi:hypothetical protein